MLHTHHGRDFFFKGLQLRPHDEPAMMQHLREGGLEFGFKWQVLGVDVEKWDGHGKENDEARMMNDEWRACQ
jgi:hypothetical protein